MTSQTVKIMNKIGIHARPASLLVNTAGQFASDIRIKKGDRIAAAKSMINLLALRAKMDDTVTVEADGEDEKEAVQALVELISTKFGGEE
ncbi:MULTISPECIES: HPr family phosphocarrier protein [Caproicibacterium]|uniref:Phosphocarrier protein HPr n=1 Tax=Caproicibacterium argilliputei TaxID=3030016 RepID=A0AA97H278_9FIRM|nr:HPr family phosphocarrier protein [Caproicibacterium argilliputei]WOC32460.1 HPr family phosphocarrier protein [Caproicibacterium argilliputei]